MCTRCSFIGGVAAAAAAFVTPSFALARTGDPDSLETAIPNMKRLTDTVWLGQLSPNVWLHTVTHKLDAGEWYPANGAIVLRGDHALMIDTGWTPDQTRALLAQWHGTGKPPITKALVTHWHADRLGGIPVLNEAGIESFGNPLTIGLAIDNGYAPPKPLHDLEKKPASFEGVEVYYPGEGHTLDNIVAWIPDDDMLMAGCLIKALGSPDLGYTDDGNVATYARTVQNVRTRYAAKAKFVVPGHGGIKGDSLSHTLTLAKNGKRWQ
jgi:metallo-beta-lactamase class B